MLLIAVAAAVAGSEKRCVHVFLLVWRRLLAMLVVGSGVFVVWDVV